MPIIWDKEYNLGFTIIDTQHQKFVETINKFYLAINGSEGKDSLMDIFEELNDYIDEHFETEEKFFGEFNYETSFEHKELHQKFRDKITDLKKSFMSGDDSLDAKFKIVDYLEDWLVDHLANEDKKYVKCFQEHGLK